MTPRANPADVLLVGWSGPALAALTALGVRVMNVFDAKDFAKARAATGAEFIAVPDTTSIEDVLAGLTRENLPLDGFATVCTMREFSLVPTALLAAAGKCAGMPVDTALALRDKFVQKRLVRAAGLPVTACRVVELLADLAERGWDGRVVVKPLAGGGARDTYVLTRAEDLARLLERSPAVPPGPWLVEDLVEGAELHVDGVVRAGVVRWFAVSRYLRNVIDIHVGAPVGAVVLGPGRHTGLYGSVEALLGGALEALGHHDGVFHVEVFERDGELTFSECAGRLGGGMIQETLAHRFGVDLPGEWARAVLGRPNALAPVDRGGHCGYVQLSAPPGVVVDLPDQDSVLGRPGCVRASISLEKGAECPDNSVASNLKAGKALVVGESEQQVEERLLALAEWFRATVVVRPEPAPT